MKKHFTKALSIMLVLVFMVSTAAVLCIPASAATYITGANAATANYKSSRYYANFQKVELTGDGRTDVLAVALSQLGYQESPTAGDTDGIGGGSGNYTEYNYNMGDFGVGYGGSSYAWCATFVSWALLQSGCTTQNTMGAWCRNHTGDSNYIWREVSCSQWANQLRRYGYFQKSAAASGSYKPQSGDLIFFSWSGATSSEDHIGIVVYNDGTNVYTIEGNTSNQSGLEDDGGGVYFKKYSLSYNCITGYGVLPYKTADVPKIDYSGANPTNGYYMANASKYIYANADDTSYTWTSQRFTMFEVIGVASNGRLKANITTSTGTTVTGYVLNNDDRVIQITSAEEAEPPFSIKHSATLSTGKSYTTTATNRGDIYDDDKKRLTDGAKVVSDPGQEGSSGWNNTDKSTPNVVEVIVDLGSSVATNKYDAYLSGGAWGIDLPKDYITVSIFASDDNVNFTSVSKDGEGSYTLASGDESTTDNKWSIYQYSITVKKTVTARYIKFVFTASNSGNAFIWLNEVEANLDLSNDTVITGVNEVITSGRSVIFTPSFNSGALTESNSGTAWTCNVVLEWNSFINAYVVVYKAVGLDDGWNLTSNQLLIATHYWEDVDDPVEGSAKNFNNLKSTTYFQVGDIVRIHGVDLNSATVSENAFVESVSYMGDINDDISISALDYMIIKRSCLATYTLSESQKLNADVNGDGEIGVVDYMILKRYCLGTAEIEQNF